ncbi:GntR family transcriptional regulator [Falsibacillus albus]|uniref:GntR family transcriptional regulator n=1 Tax=Falsibacillus albus TaxID=2478915 RepID=A0A3L7K780_9BACI|nr:GntR family transcriptional regulator [Falsibacillus albus]RLQ98104.1 GntR family transcriptional regulator [Falsibacillus albus]
MSEEFQASKPIYIQIADRLINRIVRRELLPGDKLPSVRELALQSGVNPNTVQRTYSEMERMGIVETRRGQGTFVTEKDDILMGIKVRMKNDIIDAFVKNMMDLGLTKGEIIDGLNNFLVEDGGERNENRP